MSDFAIIDKCILCSSTNLMNLFQLRDSPLANEFVTGLDGFDHQEKFPLHLNKCSRCNHVQLGHAVSPNRMFSNYAYVSGTTKSFVKHFHDLADQLISRWDLKSSSYVVEIGSNDGTLLKHFMDCGIPVLGVDPAANIATMANESGVPTRNDYFTSEVASEIRIESGLADVIIANNVLAHTTLLGDIVTGVKDLLAPNGVLVFEVSYLLDVVQKLLFDTIYHEHVSYHSVKPLLLFFDHHGLELFEVEMIESHGGSIRVYVQHKNGPREIHRSIASAIKNEDSSLLHDVSTYTTMKRKIDDLNDRFRALLAQIKDSEHHICGFGAPAKATTLMNEFNLDSNLIEFIIDDSPLKQGLFTPGLHIPIYPRNFLSERPPSHIVIFAWNFAQSITADLKGLLGDDVTYIIPLPELKVI